MKVFNLAGTVDLLRELACRQTKVGTSSSSPSIRILQKLTTSPSSTPRQVLCNVINHEVIRLTRQLEGAIGVTAAPKM